MSEEKLTPWFPPEIKPVYRGMYETRVAERWGPLYGYWDGDVWRFEKNDIPMIYQNRQWRGLAEKPKKR